MEISKTFIYASLILWQIGFIIGILLKLFYKPSGKKIASTVVSNTPTVEVDTPKTKPSHIDVEMKKKIISFQLKKNIKIDFKMLNLLKNEENIEVT